jgi:DNA-binding response OmpR family regulator
MIDFGKLKQYTQNTNILIINNGCEYFDILMDYNNNLFSNVTISSSLQDGAKLQNEHYNKNNRYFDLIILNTKSENQQYIKFISYIYKINPKQFIFVISSQKDFDHLLILFNLGIDKYFTIPLDQENYYNEIYKISQKIYAKSINKSSIIKINNQLQWDKKKQELIKNGKIVKLTKKEILLLDKLLDENKQVHQLEDILISLWGDSFGTNDVNITSLKTLISRLRKKLPDINIKNIYGLGYKIETKS